MTRPLAQVWLTLATALIVVLSTLVSSASAAGGVRADDFERGIEVPSPAGVTAGPETLSAHTDAMAGPRKVAVLLFNFTDNRTEPWTADEVRSAIFTGASSVNAFQQEQQSDGPVRRLLRARPGGRWIDDPARR